MKFVVEQEKLVHVLDMVYKAVDPKNPVDMLRNFCFRDRLVAGYNSSFGISALLPTNDCEIPLPFCVPADRMLGVVKCMSGTINCVLNKNSLMLTCGKNKTRMNVSSAVGYPSFVPQLPVVPILVHDGSLSSSLRLVHSIANVAKSHTSIDGVGMRGKYVYWTDGVMLVRVGMDVSTNEEYVLSSGSIGAILALPDMGIVRTDGNRFVAEYLDGRVLLVSVLSATKYPFDHIDNVLAGHTRREYDCEFPRELAAGISRVCSVARSKDESQTITLESHGGILVVRCVGTEIGESVEEFDWECGHEFSIKVDSRYLLSALKHTRSANLTNVLSGDGRYVRFDTHNFTHLVALRT